MTTLRSRPAARRARTSFRTLVAAGRAGVATVGLACVATAWAQSEPAPAAPAAPAAESGLQFNGFGTVSAVSVQSPDDWGFRREVTQPAHADRPVRFDTDSRLGLQADWRASAQWEFVGQLLLKPRPPHESDQESITQAFVAWRPSTDWTLRLGRTSPDLFLLSDSRNVGFSYPWMRPSVDYYGWVPLRTIDGLDVTRQWLLGDTRVRAKLFGGRSMVTFADEDNFADRARIEFFGGGTFTVDSGPWTLKATFARADSHPVNAGLISLERGALDQISMLPIPVVAQQAATLRDSFPTGILVTRYSALGMIWDADPWQVQAELARIDGNFDTSRAWYGYASVARRFGESTTLFVMAGRARSSDPPLPEPQWTAALTPVVGPALAGQAQYAASAVSDSFNGGREDQHSISIGGRYDLSARVALKAQLDDVHSAPFGGGLWAANSYASHHALVYSVGVDFVF